jgi:putative transposase
MIEARFEGDLHNVLVAKAQELGAFVYAVGGIDDHVHIVASVPPRISLAEFVGQLKGSSSHCVNHQFLGHCRFAWQEEYGVVSFGGKQLDTVVNYVKNQHSHHAEGSLMRALERSQPAHDAPGESVVQPPVTDPARRHDPGPKGPR